MFDKRDDLVRFLAVAESGKILAAADRLAITQPALSRVIARLEARFGGKLFERLTTGVRLTPLGDRVAGLARGLLREIQAAEEKIDAAVSGRTMSFRVTASPMWMEAVLAPAVAQFHHRFPSVELTLRTAPFADGLRLLEDGENDLHCGDTDAGRPLPAFLRRQRFIDMTAGIVASEGHPLLTDKPGPRDLTAWPWIDYDAPVPAAFAQLPIVGKPSYLDSLLDRLHRETGRCVETVLRAGTAGLYLLATGPWLSWLPLNFLERLTRLRLRPLPLAIGRQRYRTGFVVRRSAEDLAPFRLLVSTVRNTALEQSVSSID